MIWQRVKCWLFGHELYEAEILSDNARRVRCDACSGQWAVHKEFGWCRWDKDFEAFYNREWKLR